ncbi:MAG: SDR family NAD(P)-dependent oxidoreductase [Rhizobiaceae bacterium]
MARFSGKVAIVTGGARGIGEETCRQFANQGGKVVIGDNNVELGQALADEIGGDAVFFKMDVADPTSCAAAVEKAFAEFGSIDCVVNSAIQMAPGLLKDLSLEDWNKTVMIGLTGTFLMSQAAGRWMIDHDHKGSIVNLSSIGGITPYGMSGAYSTVKAAVIMLSKHLAIEWAAKGIRVNAVCPGHTETPLTAYLQDPEIKKGRSEVTPTKRVGQPIDIANSILFLLSDEADYITAESILVDGGLAASVMNHLPGRKWD